jgi:hypothetical protein
LHARQSQNMSRLTVCHLMVTRTREMVLIQRKGSRLAIEATKTVLSTRRNGRHWDFDLLATSANLECRNLMWGMNWFNQFFVLTLLCHHVLDLRMSSQFPLHNVLGMNRDRITHTNRIHG